MKNFVILILTGLVLAFVVITQTLSRYSDTITPYLNLLSERNGIWYKARTHAEKNDVVLNNWLLNDEVKMTRDVNGVMHISASNEADVYVSWGYVIARDRFFQLQYLKRAAAGRLSEIFGSRAVAADAAFHSLGLEAAANLELQAMSEEEYALLRSFTNGINLYLSTTNESDYPLEIRVLNTPVSFWRPVDCLMVIKLWEYLNSFSLEGLEQQIIAKNLENPSLYADLYGVQKEWVPEKDPGADAMELHKKLFSDQTERNKWLPKPDTEDKDFALVIPPYRTQRGNAVFAGFLAGSFTFPGVLYEVQITTPRFNAYGFSLAGAPFMVAGFTPNAAWSFNRPSGQAVSYHYLNSDSPEVEIKTQTANWIDRNGVKRSSTAHYSTLGPVFRSLSSEVVVRWSAFSSSGGVSLNNALFKMENVAEFDGFRDNAQLSSTLKIADQKGNGRKTSLYKSAERAQHGISALKTDHVDRLIYGDATTQENAGHNRFKNLLNVKSKHSVDEVLNYMRDNTIPSPELKRLVLQATKNAKEKEWSNIRSDLEVWNMQASVESKLTPIMYSFVTLMRKYTFDEFYDLVTSSLPPDESWIELAQTNPGNAIFDLKSTAKKETAFDIMDMALNDALNMNVIENGQYNAWSWGEINKVKPVYFAANGVGEMFTLSPIPYDGFLNTINPSFGRNANYGFTHAFLIEFRNGSPTALVNVLGQNQSMPSNYEVQLSADVWAKKQFRAVRFHSESTPVDGKTVTIKPVGQ